MEEIKLTTKTTKKSLIDTVKTLVENYAENDVTYFICSFLPIYNINKERNTLEYIEEVISKEYIVKSTEESNVQIINAINFAIKHFNDIKPIEVTTKKKTTRKKTAKSSK